MTYSRNKPMRLGVYVFVLVHSVQFSSVTQSCSAICDPMNRSTQGIPVHHQFPEFSQTRVHRVSDAIQPSHPLSYIKYVLLILSLLCLRGFSLKRFVFISPSGRCKLIKIKFSLLEHSYAAKYLNSEDSVFMFRLCP